MSKSQLLETKQEKDDKIRTITEELLAKLNQTYADGKELDSVSRHESDTSSMAEERELHGKLD